MDKRQRLGSCGMLSLMLLSAVLCLAVVPAPASAAGTSAGQAVTNQAELRFRLTGASADGLLQASVDTLVDELLDVVVVSDDSGPVPVGSPSQQAVLQYSVTNTGNGNEVFRLVANPSVVGDEFDVTNPSLFFETNGLPGLQTGAGGDTPYTLGSNDPLLAADASLVVYAQVDVPSGLNAADIGLLELRAVASTVISNAGTDDPDAPAFPPVATAYAGAGDALSGPPVNAVVGTTHDSNNLLLRAAGAVQVSDEVLSLTKAAVAISDPSGGTALVPGSLVTYELAVTVSTGATASDITITDPVPTDLIYQPGSLSVSTLPAGQEIDDDFEPAGVDSTGFDETTGTVRAVLGEVIGDGSTITIRFQAAVR